MNDSLPEPYQFKAQPAIYRGVQMRSMLEVQTARALDRIGVIWEYEPKRFADEQGIYTPDFRIDTVRVKGWANVPNQFTELYVEARPTMEGEFRKKAERAAATLDVSTDTPLLFVGMREMPTHLLGWCYGIDWDADPVLAVLGRWSGRLDLDGIERAPEPCLYVREAAAIWTDGFYTDRPR
jgi:hypothetical protein